MRLGNDLDTTSEKEVLSINFDKLKDGWAFRLLIIKRNNQGPNLLPWGTPAGT